jgi:hypothetical protein
LQSAATVDQSVPNWPDAPHSGSQEAVKPDGKLLFIDHGLSPEPGIERWQQRLTSIWCHGAGGCHLDWKIDNLIHSAGFVLTKL